MLGYGANASLALVASLLVGLLADQFDSWRIQVALYKS